MPRGEFDRSARKAATRARLLEAAARVYAARGFAGATLDDVALEAGLTKGAVYGHFGSKDNLLVALMDEYVAGKVAQQVGFFDRDETTWKRPFVGSDTFMRELDEEPDAFRLLIEFWLAATRDEQLRERFADGFHALRGMFAEFCRESAIDAGIEPLPEVDDTTANVSLALSLGLGLLRVVDPANVSPATLGTALSVFIRAIERDEELRADMADPAARIAREQEPAG
ncbi:TetR/AcrR family transcriptional regulator [Conexibacter sp. JD483]|uniref:TetR/AcrR family transcriptional regulator n=1 Tax=unclassified Conexibacter TaxID=2627773 RepID=UPI00272914BD|nr:MULTISPECIES: TetR/AcrR family transcriptional regulator [unclassified Conexibacter]MDO8186932.1 TetR/AcrR family transcriptional regulator [Conexibacter sp. CPCC 205706]MDO8200613.1 TetR/AcrR family transcriptional regulator [Conexibacter sp. CPCC 205762]MDR9368809.1 TetR/AcrR family transcriptional regulator [Conexibacter sp. JD483]